MWYTRIILILKWCFFIESSKFPVFRIWNTFCVILSLGTISSKYYWTVLEVTKTSSSVKLIIWLVFSMLSKKYAYGCPKRLTVSNIWQVNVLKVSFLGFQSILTKMLRCLLYSFLDSKDFSFKESLDPTIIDFRKSVTKFA